MHAEPLRRSAALLALLLAAGCSSELEKYSVPVPVGSIVTNASLSALQDSGWSICFEEPYGQTGTPIAAVLGNCQGTYMMLGCRANPTANTLIVAAADFSTVVTQPDPAQPDAFHASGAVGWYFTDTSSWGFFPVGDTVFRSSCDVDVNGTEADSEKRLCWHANGGNLNGGFRCGVTTFLNGDLTWRRVVLVHN